MFFHKTTVLFKSFGLNRLWRFLPNTSGPGHFSFSQQHLQCEHCRQNTSNVTSANVRQDAPPTGISIPFVISFELQVASFHCSPDAPFEKMSAELNDLVSPIISALSNSFSRNSSATVIEQRCFSHHGLKRFQLTKPGVSKPLGHSKNVAAPTARMSQPAVKNPQAKNTISAAMTANTRRGSFMLSLHRIYIN